jgi:nicotinamide mononucleotide transporter
MEHLLSVQTVAVTILGYPMSWIELIGTVFNLWCVWLVVRNKILNWPVGLIGVVLFGIMFWQIRLYADLFEQGYFFVTGIIGWWVWAHPRLKEEEDARGELAIGRLSTRQYASYGVAIVVATVAATWVMAHLHLWVPALFPEPASYPFLDSLTTVMSFVAQFMLVRRLLENWVLWIAVDAIGVGLYWVKDVRLVSVLYAIFLCMAINGLISWIREHRARMTAVQHT